MWNETHFLFVCLLRRDHLTPEQIKEFEHLQKKLESGRIEEKDFVSWARTHTHTQGALVYHPLTHYSFTAQEDDKEDRDLIPSMPPPDKPTITWDQYCHAPTDQWEKHCMHVDIHTDKCTWTQ